MRQGRGVEGPDRKTGNERPSKAEGGETGGKDSVSRRSELLAAHTAERLSQRNDANG